MQTDDTIEEWWRKQYLDVCLDIRSMSYYVALDWILGGHPL